MKEAEEAKAREDQAQLQKLREQNLLQEKELREQQAELEKVRQEKLRKEKLLLCHHEQWDVNTFPGTMMRQLHSEVSRSGLK